VAFFLLEMLQEYDFHVLWPTVRLITILLANKTREIQEVILANPLGISRLMDLLVDSREIIRNDVCFSVYLEHDAVKLNLLLVF
jgi:hypothetical protein